MPKDIDNWWYLRDSTHITFVTDKTISSWESNRTEPSMEMLIRLSEILECNVSYLLYGENFKDNIEMEIKVKLTKAEYDNLNEIMKNNKMMFILNLNFLMMKILIFL